MKRSLLIAFVVIAVMLLIGIIAVSRLNLGAIAEPSRAEVYFATAAKHLLVRVASRAENVSPSAGNQGSIAGADKLYGAANLTTTEVQSYSDRELFGSQKMGFD